MKEIEHLGSTFFIGNGSILHLLPNFQYKSTAYQFTDHQSNGNDRENGTGTKS